MSSQTQPKSEPKKVEKEKPKSLSTVCENMFQECGTCVSEPEIGWVDENGVEHFSEWDVIEAGYSVWCGS